MNRKIFQLLSISAFIYVGLIGSACRGEDATTAYKDCLDGKGCEKFRPFEEKGGAYTLCLGKDCYNACIAATGWPPNDERCAGKS